MKEFQGIEVTCDLQIAFEAIQGAPLVCGIELIEENP